MRRWLAYGLLLGVLGACDGTATSAPKREPTKERVMSPSEPVVVTWHLRRDEAHHELVLDYEITNRGTTPIVLIDQLYATSSKGATPLFERAVVVSASADTVRFVRGFVKPEQPVEMQAPPIARTLDPGAAITGVVHVPWPLVAWHNFDDSPRALTGTPKQAVLEIGYLVGHDKWGKVLMVDGTKQRVPNPPYITEQRFARGAPIALP